MRIPVASNNKRIWFSWCGYWLSVAILIVASVIAVASIAYIVGWLTGASMTPVVAIVIPLVFGLLAAIGVGIGAPRPFSDKTSIWQSVFVALLVIVFCHLYFYGVTLGSFQRSSQYNRMSNLLGETWDNADDDTVALLYRFRLKARQAKLSPADFQPIIRDVIRPILQDDQPDKHCRIEKALTTIESALPSPN